MKSQGIALCIALAFHVFLLTLPGTAARKSPIKAGSPTKAISVQLNRVQEKKRHVVLEKTAAQIPIKREPEKPPQKKISVKKPLEIKKSPQKIETQTPKTVLMKPIETPSILPEPTAKDLVVTEKTLPKQDQDQETLKTSPTVDPEETPNEGALLEEDVIQIEKQSNTLIKAPIPAENIQIEHIKNPSYPISARRQQREGTVQLKIQVLENGGVGKVELYKTSGWEDLDEAALKAVTEWHFRPATRNGRPIRQAAIFPIHFTLR